MLNMNNKSDKETYDNLVIYLKKLSLGETPNNNNGVCKLIYDRFGITIRYRPNLNSFHNYSEDPNYPIRSPYIHTDKYSKDVYARQAFNEELKWSGQYGESRRKFCEWLLKIVRPEIVIRGCI